MALAYFLLMLLALQKYTTISRQLDVAAIVSKGPTVTGNLVIATNAAGPINLDGIHEITGNLSCRDSQITSLSCPSMHLITGYMILSNLTYLSIIKFPILRKVGGIIWWAISNLDVPDFEWGLDVVPYIHIENTWLTSIGNINTISVSYLAVVKNNRLRTLKLDLESIQGNITVANNRGLKVVDLGRAKKATYIQLVGNFTDIRGLDTIKSLSVFDLNITAPWDCSQYGKAFEVGHVKCVSANSTYSTTNATVSISSPLPGPTNLASIIPNTGQTNIPIPSPPANQIHSKRLPHYGIALIVLGALVILSGIVLYYIRVRKSRNRASKSSNLVELPLGGHNEKVELAVEERPAELSVEMIRKYDSPPKAMEKQAITSPLAHIVDVKDFGEFSHVGQKSEDEAVRHPQLQKKEP